MHYLWIKKDLLDTKLTLCNVIVDCLNNFGLIYDR